MSSTNKTPKLKLNSWVGTDVPCRDDFVRDNKIIDEMYTLHSENNDIHITPEERKKWDTQAYYTAYTGNGSNFQDIKLNIDFEPRWGYVYPTDYPVTTTDFDNKTVYHYFGFITKGDNLNGLELKGKILRAENTFSRLSMTEMLNFNERGVMYQIVVFR